MTNNAKTLPQVTGSVTVHHVKEFPNVTADKHIYCGPGQPRNPEMIDANLGNPHPINWCNVCGCSHTRNNCIKAYRNTIARDACHPHWKTIRLIGQRAHEGLHLALYCFCKPEACHADLIAELALLHAQILTNNANENNTNA